MLIMLAIFVILAILAPFAGADSRDGLDWKPGHFWPHSRKAQNAR